MSEITTFTAGLRSLADWYDTHPDMPLPERTWRVFGFDSKEQAAAVVAAFGTCRKQYTDNGLLYIEKDFGCGSLSFVFNRESVCVRKVLGRREVPEKVTPAHEEEIVAWECEPILAADPEGAAVEAQYAEDAE